MIKRLLTITLKSLGVLMVGGVAFIVGANMNKE